MYSWQTGAADDAIGNQSSVTGLDTLKKVEMTTPLAFGCSCNITKYKAHTHCVFDCSKVPKRLGFGNAVLVLVRIGFVFQGLARDQHGWGVAEDGQAQGSECVQDGSEFSEYENMNNLPSAM
eukprot:2119157-Amphidinium_carterae.1